MKKYSLQEKLQNVLEVARQISCINDLDALLEHLLTEARSISNADAGSIYIVKDDKVCIKYAQNDTIASRIRGGKLPYTFFSYDIDDKSMAGYAALTGKSVNIEDAYNLPPSVPFSFNKQTDEATYYRTKSVFTMPLKAYSGRVLGVLQIINAQDEDGNVVPFDSDAEMFLEQLASSATQVFENAYLSDEMISRMLMMAAFRDPKETYPHIERVARFAVEIYDRWAEEHGVSAEEHSAYRDNLRIAAKFHDVGKVGISDLILKKTFPRLDENERAIMKGHTLIGAQMFMKGTTEADKMSFDVALHHHERWDGGSGGYPGKVDFSKFEPGMPLPKFEALKGEEIPFSARVVAVADVFDALCHSRSYKAPWKVEDAIEAIKADAGHHFDPEVVKNFLDVKTRILAILRLHNDE